MYLKALLHCHTSSDPHDTYISYSDNDLIDYCHENGFEVLSITCHHKVIFKKATQEYALSKGIILIPGVELETDGRKHTLILNAHKDAEKIKSYKDIQQYKVKHPESMIIAPHPYYPAKECHRGNTEKYIHLFDALECSWFNHPLFNFNRRAKEVCKKHNKPFIATPDCHFMRNIGTSYCTIKSKTRTTADIISALKGGEFKNTNKTISFTKFILTLIWIIYGKLFFDRQSRRKLK